MTKRIRKHTAVIVRIPMGDTFEGVTTSDAYMYEGEAVVDVLHADGYRGTHTLRVVSAA